MFPEIKTESPHKFTIFSTGEEKHSNHTAESASGRSSKVCKASRRRTVRACMRCRLRKTKCDGGKPCTRCTEADDVCEYMKCSKKEIKEYSQDYVDRLLEQNDKYKTAMRILYANRRLSIQSDNIIIPSIESNDTPLVHDILDRLGMLCHDDDTNSQSSTPESHIETYKEPTLTYSKTLSTPSILSVPSPSDSMFTPTLFDEAALAIDATMETNFFPETNPMALNADIGLTVPYEVYSSMNTAQISSDYSQYSPDFTFQDLSMNVQDWCPLSGSDPVANGADFQTEQSWDSFQPSY